MGDEANVYAISITSTLEEETPLYTYDELGILHQK